MTKYRNHTIVIEEYTYILYVSGSQIFFMLRTLKLVVKEENDMQ